MSLQRDAGKNNTFYIRRRWDIPVPGMFTEVLFLTKKKPGYLSFFAGRGVILRKKYDCLRNIKQKAFELVRLNVCEKCYLSSWWIRK